MRHSAQCEPDGRFELQPIRFVCMRTSECLASMPAAVCIRRDFNRARVRTSWGFPVVRRSSSISAPARIFVRRLATVRPTVMRSQCFASVVGLESPNCSANFVIYKTARLGGANFVGCIVAIFSRSMRPQSDIKVHHARMTIIFRFSAFIKIHHRCAHSDIWALVLHTGPEQFARNGGVCASRRCRSDAHTQRKAKIEP